MCVRVCVYINIYTYICIYSHTHTHTHTRTPYLRRVHEGPNVARSQSLVERIEETVPAYILINTYIYIYMDTYIYPCIHMYVYYLQSPAGS